MNPVLPSANLPDGLPRLSACGQVWHLPAPQAVQEGHQLAQLTGESPIIGTLLAQRGVTTPEQLVEYLNPSLKQLPDPLTLKDMEAATTALVEALTENAPICIFGDYDVDGTCATAMLTRYFQALGVPVERYIPDRLVEGYGPNPEAMRTIAARGTKVLITVDTGTNAHAALNEAAALGLKVIVTDHHPQAGALPPACAIVNPHRADDVSELAGLCGSGVAFYLLMNLNRTLRAQGFFHAERPEPRLTNYLDLVGLATVADVMPLTGPNRTLVLRGLEQLAARTNPGLAALCNVAKVGTDYSGYTFGFVLGPRLNAAGRIDNAEAAVSLLLAEAEADALQYAVQLDELNGARQALEKNITFEALRQAEAQMQEPETLALVLAHPDWHPGVVGIVASRVREKTNRPCFVIGRDTQGQMKGSGRSAGGLDLGAAVHAAQECLISGGGHAAAAGVTLHEANLPQFRAAVNTALWAQLRARFPENWPLAHMLAPQLEVVGPLAPASLVGEAGIQFARQLARLGPFGNGNPEPILHMPHVLVQGIRAVGADASHLRVTLRAPLGGPTCEAMAFRAADSALGQLLTAAQGRVLDALVTVKSRQFNGRTLLDLVMKDARLSQGAAAVPPPGLHQRLAG